MLRGDNFEVKVRWRNRYGREMSYTSGFEGVVPYIERQYVQAETDVQRARWAEYLREVPCPVCNGKRLKPEVLAVLIHDHSIADVGELSLTDARAFMDRLQLTEREQAIGAQVLREIKVRLDFLIRVGLSYLDLARAAGTLSGGEAQRIRLATQIGSGLTGVLYVLDEPSIGLHQRDNRRLIDTLVKLKNLGNTLIVVEHDEDTIRTADWIVDIGPGAGEHGGKVVHSGDYEALLQNTGSITGDYIAGRRAIAMPTKRRAIDPARQVTVEGARANNLKDVTVSFPLGTFVAVTGVSYGGYLTTWAIGQRPDRFRAAIAENPISNLASAFGAAESDGGFWIDELGGAPWEHPAMYALGIDLGTTYTAAATWRDGHAEIVALGSRAAAVPSVVLLREDETFLTGEAASRRGLTEPHRVAREFKRRMGDTTPILLGGVPQSAEGLAGRLMRAVTHEVIGREGGPPSATCVSYPANWGPYKTDLMRQAVAMADLRGPVVYTTEPEAAAVSYAQQQRIEPGAVVAVYDLGGGTFDAAVLRKTATGFTILGRPEGIERLGGIDFDAAVFSHVAAALGGSAASALARRVELREVRARRGRELESVLHGAFGDRVHVWQPVRLALGEGRRLRR